MGRYKMYDSVPSKASLDPYMALANGVLVRAIKDMGDEDPVIALGAIDWFHTDAEFYLDHLGYQIGVDEAFVKAVKYAAS